MSTAAVIALLFGGDSVEFIRSQKMENLTGGISNVSGNFTGMAAGDLCVVWAVGASGSPPTLGGGSTGWTSVTLTTPAAFAGRLFWKVLTGGDITTGFMQVVFNDQDGGLLLGYRRATGVTVAQTNTGTGTGLTLSAATPIAGTAGVVALVGDQDAGAAFTAPSSPGLATRLGPGTDMGQGARAAYDFIEANDYPVANLTWAGFTNSADQWGHLLWLTV